MTDKAPLIFEAKLGMLKPALLRQLLVYHPETGELFWRERDISMFTDGKQSAAQNCNIWNGKFAGKPALASLDKRGYRHGHILSKQVKAHRAIWAMQTGAWPSGDIDHINGKSDDNRWINLRHVTHAENGRNVRLKATNKSGHCGVWRRPSGRWAAVITIDGRSRTIGTYDTIELAAAARKKAEKANGFHENHGAAR